MTTAERLVQLGGRLWERGDMKRVYLNDDVLAKLVPHIIERDGDTLWIGTHRVTQAIRRELDGLGTRYGGAVWYDAGTGTIETKDVRGHVRDAILRIIDRVLSDAAFAAEVFGTAEEAEATSEQATETIDTPAVGVRTAVGPGLPPATRIRRNSRPGYCRICRQLVPAGAGRLYYIDPDEAYEDSGWIVEHLDGCPTQ